MLGRLEMDVDDCISAYLELTKSIFEEKLNSLPFGFTGNMKPQFDSRKLEEGVQEILTGHGASKTDLLNDGAVRGCNV